MFVLNYPQITYFIALLSLKKYMINKLWQHMFLHCFNFIL